MSSVSFLLVDDLEENLLSLEALLRRDGLVLLKARSGDQALELLLQHDVALALVDVQMPGLNGFELAELMRGNERTKLIPIIFVTAGNTNGQWRFQGYEAGAVDFIQKPIEPDILRSKAEVFFELYRQRQQIAEQRDELKVTRAQQDVLLREINHRIKNLFSITSGLIYLSARTASSVDELADDLAARLKALARAHDLTLPDLSEATDIVVPAATVIALLKAILAPHENEQSRISISGEDVAISGSALTSFALLLHELTTNSAKYGALSTSKGRLDIELKNRDGRICLLWNEQTFAPLVGPGTREGFGRTLERSVLRSLGGTLERDWSEQALKISLQVPLSGLAIG